jgi:hypothetical protein
MKAGFPAAESLHLSIRVKVMKNTLRLIGVTAMAIVIATFLSRLLRACNPYMYDPEPIFVNTLHPDLPIAPYAQGNLGVIQPTYGSIYLYVAYRNLVGRPIQPSEQEALWGGDERLTGYVHMTLREAIQKQSLRASQAGPSPDWAQAWASASGQAYPQEPNLLPRSFGFVARGGIYREIALHEFDTVLYSQFLNCPQDAFRDALNTLKQRKEQFGEISSVVQNWIDAQKTVFENCSAVGTVPDDLPPSAPAIARADRAYQQAAASFYAGEYDDAIAAFRAIAQDSSSPWSTIAPYLVARALVRKATVIDKLKPDLATLGQAETQIESVLANPRLTPYHHAAEQLRGFIEFRLHPRQRLEELADNLMRKPNDPDLAQDAIDFRLLFSRSGGIDFSTEPNPSGGEVNARRADARAKSDLLDWMLTLQQVAPAAYSHGLEKWEGTHSMAWLVAALTTAEPTSPRVPELLAAARQVPAHSPAYDSVTFQSLRLMLLEGKNDEVRERLAHLRIHQMGSLAPEFSTPPSTMNLFLALRFELAQNLDELFASAVRIPATITDQDTGAQLPKTIWTDDSFDPSAARFHDDSLFVLNRLLPVALLAKAARSPKLPATLRHQVALAAWTRAALLGNADVARSLAPEVEAIDPRLGASVEAYNSAATPEARRFAAALATLRFPGLRPFITTLERVTPIDEIDSFRENWWDVGVPPCGLSRGLGILVLQVDSQSGKPPDPLTAWPPVGPVFLGIYPGGKVKPPAFLTAAERAQAEQESKQLVALGAAPDYLSSEAIAWAKTHPGDPRVPEALALAVKSTRFGCTDKDTAQFSKAAFDLLHRRYPKSSWAQMTKYWFKG